MSNDEPRLQRLLIWPQFGGSEWQLPTGAKLAAQRELVGWSVDQEEVEATVPQVVARLLTMGLCRHAVLTFASAIRAPFGATLVPRRWKLGQHFRWISTSDPEEAADGIFYADLFSWNQQGQVVVLSQHDSKPALEEHHLELANNEAAFGELARAGHIGVMLPGVDGQVVGLYVFEQEYARRIGAELKRCALEFGVGFDVAVGEAFRAGIK